MLKVQSCYFPLRRPGFNDENREHLQDWWNLSSSNNSLRNIFLCDCCNQRGTVKHNDYTNCHSYIFLHSDLLKASFNKRLFWIGGQLVTVCGFLYTVKIFLITTLSTNTHSIEVCTDPRQKHMSTFNISYDRKCETFSSEKKLFIKLIWFIFLNAEIWLNMCVSVWEHEHNDRYLISVLSLSLSLSLSSVNICQVGGVINLLEIIQYNYGHY